MATVNTVDSEDILLETDTEPIPKKPSIQSLANMFNMSNVKNLFSGFIFAKASPTGEPETRNRYTENMIYMVIVGILLSYIVVVTLKKYNDILYTMTYARRMQATCGSHAMEKETARSILSTKLASPEFIDSHFNNSLMMAGGAIVAYCIGFAVVYKVYSKDAAFWSNNNVIVFHVIVFMILTICVAIWGVFHTLPEKTAEYRRNRDVVATGLFKDIPATVGSTDKKPSTVMLKIRDSIIKRMAHADNLESYDDAVNAYTLMSADQTAVLKYAQFDNSSVQNITPDMLNAKFTLELWNKWLKSNNYTFDTLKAIPDGSPYSTMRDFITTNIKPSDSTTKKENITKQLKELSSVLQYKTEYATMVNAATDKEDKDNILASLYYLSDFKSGDPTDAIAGALAPLQPPMYIVGIIVCYSIFHWIAQSIVKVQDRIVAFVVVLGLILASIVIVKIYLMYKNKS